jgi:hypothetical protein
VLRKKILEILNAEFLFEPHRHIRHIEKKHIEIYFVFYVVTYVSMCLCGSISSYLKTKAFLLISKLNLSPIKKAPGGAFSL